MESMMEGARDVIRALETALEKARQNERSLADTLARL